LAQTEGTGTIRGQIVDARDGTPLEKVSVRVHDTERSAVTTSDGRFELYQVPSGPREIYVSAVDFILVRRMVDVPPGGVLDLTIPIAAGTGTYSETVDVSTTTGDRTVSSGTQILRSNELQQLRGVITNDPMRAIHVLPGVTTGDDLRSEFSVRGLPVENMTFAFEGISTPLLVHTVQGVQDTGSIAMVNGDVLQEIALAAGSYPQRHGNHTGAELNFLVREGSRDRLRGHIRPSVTDTSLVMEGPLGRTRSGSWLVSARKSYLGSVIRRIDPENTFAFGFYDAQGKLTYDLRPKHQVQLALTAGRSRLDQDPEFVGVGEVKDGVNDAGVGVVTWRYVASPRLLVTQRVAADGNRFRNTNVDGVELHNARRTDVLYRADWAWSKSSSLILEGGGEVRRTSQSGHAIGLTLTGGRFVVREDLRAAGTDSSSYVLARVSRGRASLAPGIRVDYSTLTGHVSGSPWLNTAWTLPAGLSLRIGGGVYRQEPAFAQVKGLRGSDLDGFRSFHLDAGLEGALARNLSWQVSVYNREDRDYLWLPDSEFRVENDRLILPSFLTRYENGRNGHARGVELLLQRRNPNGLAGWVSYNFAVARYRASDAEAPFYGDYDQRHTLNVYGVYRFSDRMSFSTRFRFGSNFPAPGYYEERAGGLYFLSTSRNTLRVPVYSRLDLRANRTFTWPSVRLTVFAELLNVYNRENVRAESPGINAITHRVTGLFEPMFPMIPSAGFSMEF
jgi:hypothetical protein